MPLVLAALAFARLSGCPGWLRPGTWAGAVPIISLRRQLTTASPWSFKVTSWPMSVPSVRSSLPFFAVPFGKRPYSGAGLMV